MKEDYLFWKLAEVFLRNHDYRVVSLSNSQNELWLENMSNKNAPIIRLLRYDIDWSNWIRRDLQRTGTNGERIRRKFMSRKIKVLTIYLSAFPPVDDYTWINETFYFSSRGRVTVDTILIDKNDTHTAFAKLHKYVENFTLVPMKDVFTLEDVKDARVRALQEAEIKQKEVKQLLQVSKPFFTYLLVITQCLLFLWLELQGGSTNPSVLQKYGAKDNLLILDGEWWRFFTPTFLHIGLLHLLMNTIALYFIGSEVERIFGKVRFLFIYLLSGMFGSMASFLFTDSLSAGASGAIFGCFGALLYFGYTYPQIFFRTMGMNVLLIIGINLLFGFSIQGIDNAAHIGGLLGGFVATGIVHFPNQKSLKSQGYFITGSLVILSAIFLIGF
ncbi:rhomboid family intramembrane serine protease [Bacillus spongiae]|uniref:Rhomboid family intramembrane serine protease n=1 Tax=Bacillus spongiae TaxID=2683610 RepID=A0ABU8H985_9BACI